MSVLSLAGFPDSVNMVLVELSYCYCPYSMHCATGSAQIVLVRIDWVDQRDFFEASYRQSVARFLVGPPSSKTRLYPLPLIVFTYLPQQLLNLLVGFTFPSQ